ncbi:MAG: dihydroxy-acid dehydratase [Planctomycetes bacterium]|nr:dihydroxy-acid dehydratase [Planctomycetota bacterium]
MQKIQCEVLVVGAGGAGLRAALAARKKGADVLVVNKGVSGRSGTTVWAASDWMAFTAAFGHADPRDNPTEHWIDITVKGGAVCEPALSRQIAKDAPDRFAELEQWGGNFDKTKDGKFVQILSDGARYARACGRGADTGPIIVDVLLKQCKKAGVRFADRTMLVDLLQTDDGRVIGAWGIGTTKQEPLVCLAKATILATGGAGHIYALNAFPAGMTGDGRAMALRAGAELANMEFIQIGPSIVWPIKFALSGVFWRLNPRITNRNGEEFIRRYVPAGVDYDKAIYIKGVSYPFTVRNESKWVDVAVYTEIAEGRGTDHHGVYMDISHNPARVIETEARVPFEHLMKFGVDLRKGTIEFAPAVQHFNGGILVNERAESTVPGLYAAGEEAGGQHGADRPGGNALADCQVRGRIAGDSAGAYAAGQGGMSLAGEVDIEGALADLAHPGKSGMPLKEAIEELRWAMWRNVSVVRSAEKIAAAQQTIEDLAQTKIAYDRKHVVQYLELRNMIEVARTVCAGALLREESRGTHYRPDTLVVNDPAWRKMIVQSKQGDDIVAHMKELDMPKELRGVEEKLEGMGLRSEVWRKGMEGMPARSLTYATGITPEELKKPVIAIASSFNDIIPGHIGMRDLERFIERGITAGGGVPFVFGVPGICDGIAMGHDGMKYSLASRELIADEVESMVMAHAFDGVILLTNCDKITPGMLMAAARMNLPALVVTAGPMISGRGTCGAGEGRRLSLVRDTFEAWIKHKHGQVSDEELADLEINACPGVGSCQGLYTANTMDCLTETLGMSLTGSGTALAISGKRRRLAFNAGKRIVQLIKEQKTPRQILTPEAFRNAIRVDMCMGGSSNTILHLIAIARECGIELDLDLFEKMSRETPQIVSVRPGGEDFMEDVEYAGGVPAVLSVLRQLLEDSKTVNEGSILDIAKAARPLKVEYLNQKDPKTGKITRRFRTVIHDLKKPVKPEGGLAILTGNLAPEGAVVKHSAVDPESQKFRGKAMVFNCQEDAMEAIKDLPNRLQGRGKYVIVIRYEGPKGSPGMPEMLSPTAAISGYSDEIKKRVALITDGRFSGGTRGPCIGHVCPEAMVGGPIALIEEGDTIEIDIPKRKLNLKVSGAVLAKRKKSWRPAVERKMGGWLDRYAKLVQPASKGAAF